MRLTLYLKRPVILNMLKNLLPIVFSGLPLKDEIGEGREFH
jgi:hypothetical protein